VTRNRLKRRIREFFRHECAALHGLDLVVVARSAAAAAESAALHASLQQHWTTIRKRCKPCCSS
jgi:ribonuclease P protein component